MKKSIHLSIAAVALLLCLASCGGDEPSPNQKPEPVVNPEEADFPMPEENEAVDLGLSVLWATCNFGSKGVAQHGRYVAWGDPTGKLCSAAGIDYTTSNGGGYSAWNTTNYGGKRPTESISGTDLDVVTKNWGNGWRMPTMDEARELIMYCRWTLVENYSIRRCKVTGPNGNSIILTLSGLCGDNPNETNRFSSGPFGVNMYGYYWTANTSTTKNPNRGYYVADDIVTASALYFIVGENLEYVNSNGVLRVKSIVDHLRAYHMSIRPVHDK